MRTMSNVLKLPSERRRLTKRETEIKKALDAEAKAIEILNQSHGFYWCSVRGFDVNKLRRYTRSYRDLSEQDKIEYCRYVAENEEKYPMTN